MAGDENYDDDDDDEQANVFLAGQLTAGVWLVSDRKVAIQLKVEVEQPTKSFVELKF